MDRKSRNLRRSARFDGNYRERREYRRRAPAAVSATAPPPISTVAPPITAAPPLTTTSGKLLSPPPITAPPSANNAGVIVPTSQQQIQPQATAVRSRSRSPICHSRSPTPGPSSAGQSPVINRRLLQYTGFLQVMGGNYTDNPCPDFSPSDSEEEEVPQVVVPSSPTPNLFDDPLPGPSQPRVRRPRRRGPPRPRPVPAANIGPPRVDPMSNLLADLAAIAAASPTYIVEPAQPIRHRIIPPADLARMIEQRVAAARAAQAAQVRAQPPAVPTTHAQAPPAVPAAHAQPPPAVPAPRAQPPPAVPKIPSVPARPQVPVPTPTIRRYPQRRRIRPLENWRNNHPVYS